MMSFGIKEHESYPDVMYFSPEQLEVMHKCFKERHTLPKPTVLIVEDQPFSRKLLEGMIWRDHECYSVGNAAEALEIYAEFTPCITFLDIELPDANGHDVAAFIKKHDPGSFIVMVSANHYAEDVLRAKQNHVQGFIAKPFSRGIIGQHLEKYNDYIRQMRSAAKKRKKGS